MNFLKRIGALCLAGLTGICASAAWFWMLGLPWIALDLDPAYSEIPGLPWRSLLFGLGAAATICLVQTIRLWRSKATLVSTFFLAVVTTAVDVLATLMLPVSSLSMLLGAVSLGLAFFSAAHLACFAASRVFTFLNAQALEALGGRLVVAASSLLAAPFCGGVVAADELAALAEPSKSLTADDVTALVEHSFSAADVAASNECFDALAPLREEGIRFAMATKSLQRADAEDVVGGVILSTCIPPKPLRDLKRYFFGSVKTRTVDPYRRTQRFNNFVARCPPQAHDADPETALANEGWVREQVRNLPDDERGAIELCELQGHTLEEAAARLGKSKSAVGRHLQSAKARLAEAATACRFQP